jgi:hypothetical protein
MTQPLLEMDDKTREDIKSKLLSLPGTYWDETLRRMVRIPLKEYGFSNYKDVNCVSGYL